MNWIFWPYSKMKRDYIIGNTTPHLLISYIKKIPIVVTKFEYFPFETYSNKVPIDYEPHKIIIDGKGTGYSQDELQKVLLFFLELHGLLEIRDVFSVQLEHDIKKITCYNNKFQKEICYEKLYILDSHKISYNILPQDSGSEYRAIDKYRTDKKINKYLKVDSYELYFFEGYLYIVFNILQEKLEDWESSFSHIRRKLGLEDMEYCGREIRPLFVRRIDTNDRSILYAVD